MTAREFFELVAFATWLAFLIIMAFEFGGF
jgi:hypothetical protein